MNIIITICARGGSKGIPGKNIKQINGKPLISYTIDTAFKFAKECNGIVALSTDSEEILKVAMASGLTTNYIRPEYLATDTAGKIGVLKDLLTYEESNHKKNFDYLIDLDVTSPFRSINDLTNALEIVKNDKQAINLFSVSRAHRNPYFNMVEQKSDGYFGLCKKGEFLTRQSAPAVYDMNASFYIYKRTFFEQGLSSAITEKSLVYLMDHICFDLDEPIDYLMMEFLLTNKKIDFEL